MPTYDPQKIRPPKNWVSVLADQRKTVLDSGLLLPIETGAEKVTEGMATVVRVGLGEKNDHIGVKPGDRIAFRVYLKYANPIPVEERWDDGEEKQYFLMNSDDIMGILAPGANVGVFSRPSQSAVESVGEDGSVKMAR